MKWWNRLSIKLTVFILLVAIVPLAGFGISTIHDIRRVRLQSIAQIQQEIAKNSANLVSSSLTHTAESIKLAFGNSELDSAAPDDQEWSLQLLIKASPHLDSLALLDKSGRELIKVGREQVYYQKDLGQHPDYPEFLSNEDVHPVIGKFHLTSSNRLILDMYIPFVSPMDRHVTSVIVAEVDMEKLLDFITDLKVGKTGYVYVVNAEGEYLAYPDHSAVLSRENAHYNPQVEAFVSGSTVLNTNQTYFNRLHKEVISNAREIQNPRLLVVVAQPLDEALAAVTLINKRQTSVLLVVLVIVILFSLYFTVKMVKPLRRLASGAQLIGAGTLSHRIPVTSSDELGLVTQSFNVMAENLETAHNRTNQQNWLKQGVTELDNLLRGDSSLEEICTNVVTFMAGILQQQVGLIYIHDGKGNYKYTAGYAFQPGGGLYRILQTG